MVKNTDYLQDYKYDGNNEKLIFLIHGIFSSPAIFEPFFPIFKEKGYSIYSILLKGHGSDLKSVAKIKYNEWINQINDLMQDFSRKYKEIIVIGHSMGALLALNTLDVYTTKRILLAPAYKIKITWRIIKLALYAHKDDIKDDYIQNNQFLFSVIFPNRLYKKIIGVFCFLQLIKLTIYTKHKIKTLSKPLYIIQSRKDECISSRSPNNIIKNIKNNNKRIIWLKNSYHAVFDKLEIEMIKEKIGNLLDE